MAVSKNRPKVKPARRQGFGGPIVGFVLMLVALFCAASVFGFHAGDESAIASLPWYELFSDNARTAADVIDNPFGLFGARVSVFFIRVLLGYLSVLPLIATIVLGWRLFLRNPLKPALLFLLFTLLMSLDLSAMFGLVTASFADVMSGTTGRMMASFLSTVIGYAGAWALTGVIGAALVYYMGWKFITGVFDRVNAVSSKVSSTVQGRRDEKARKQREKEEAQARNKADRMAASLEKERKKAGKKQKKEGTAGTPKASPVAAMPEPETPVSPPPEPEAEPYSAILPEPEPQDEPEQAGSSVLPESGDGPEMTINKGVKEREADLDERKLKVRTHDHVKYRFPSIDLLQRPKDDDESFDERHLAETKDRLLEKLKIYKIDVVRISTTVGPRVALFELELAPEVKISRIKSLENDLAMAMAARGIRIIAPIPGKNAVGVEIPVRKPKPVLMRPVLSVEKFKNSTMKLPIVLGKSIANEVVVDDLTTMPHLLIAGATGAGKSVAINVLLTSLLYSKRPDEVKFVLIDPKRVELFQYQHLKNHFLAKFPGFDEQIVTDPEKAVMALKSVVREMEHRYSLLEQCGVRNIGDYNKKSSEPLCYLVVVIDELADLMITAGREVEEPIIRLAQLARAVGIHLIVATQRPSVDIITGIIKANFPSRIAFQVASKVDSRTILDVSGAEQLLGNGDMLFQPANLPKPIRIQCPFVSTQEVEAITSFIGEQSSQKEVCELPEPPPSSSGSASGNGKGQEKRDAMFEEAARLVVMHQQASVSLLQRRLRLGFSRAGRVMDQLEQNGIVSPADGSKPREVLLKDDESLELLLRNLD
ncbi:MAG TPA: DNA translocase FtsK [Chlorobaculum parvum]|uniref:DNA translocase FtsK n=1 Tax=Chlorobaculum parvum TaxID=274539 RepID=A0A7C5HRC7_9CHLB|nr:DNA translocase FtsK [Chlorobaculum parvum]